VAGYPTFNNWSAASGSGAHQQIPWRPRYRRRALRGIERDLVICDPALARLFSFFTRLAENEEMPISEKVSRWPGRWFASVRGRVARLCKRGPATTPDGGCPGGRTRRW
jgi:hypothetical protein